MTLEPINLLYFVDGTVTEEDTIIDEPEPTVNTETASKSKTKDDDNDDDDKDGKEKDPEDAVNKKEEKINVFDTMNWEISCIVPSIEPDADLLIAVHSPDHDSFTIPCYYSWKRESNQIVRFNPTHLEHDHMINVTYSQSKQFLLISTQQSMVQIRDVENAENFVNIRIHSSWQRTGNLMAMTFDDRMLITSSTDGSMFCHLFDPNKLKHPSFDAHYDIDYISMMDEDAVPVPSVAVSGDIADMSSKDYSVQGEKIQRELDNAKSAAEAYKAKLRAELDEIRTKKSDILEKTKEFTKNDLGLSVSDLDIDQKLRYKMSEKLENDKKQIRREMAWNSEKIKIGLTKLENAFLKTVTVENVEVCSFRSNHAVSTFRTPLLPDWVQRDIAKVHQIINAESEKARQIASKQGGPLHSTISNTMTSTFDSASKHLNDPNKVSSSTLNTQNTGNTITGTPGDGTKDIVNIGGNTTMTAMSATQNTVSASAQKKMVREKLKSALEELQHDKPDENTDDPRDLEAIKRAQREIGDYKLKSDPLYVVPEDEHVNASQKRKQMILLLESVNYIKMGLNDRVLALRDLKVRIVDSMKTDTKRLNEINVELKRILGDGIGDHANDALEAPTIDMEREWPQHRYDFTKEDLVEFEKVLQREKEEKSGGGNAFGTGGGGNNDDDDGDHSGNGNEKESAMASAGDASKADHGHTLKGRTYLERLSGVRVSDLEHKQRTQKGEELKYEKLVLMERMDSTMHSFDAAVGELREEKSKLLNDLKLTDLKLLTLLKELSVLSEFEDREISLNGKLLKCRTEKAQVVVDLTECQERLSAKLEEIHLWQEKDRKIMKEFDNIVGERNQFYDDLKRIFKRKIKRHKRGHGGRRKEGDGNGNGDGDLSESESSSESWSDGDGADSDNSGGDRYDGDGHADKNEDDSCPKDCDNLIYEKVMELREKRLDQEEILVEFEKAVLELKAQNLSLINKEKTIDKNLCFTEKEIEQFQTEKQQVLNQIVVTVPLLASQIRIDVDVDIDGDGVNVHDKKSNNGIYRTEGILPSTIENLLIFELKSLDNLQCRIQQQKEEKLALKKDYVELRKLHKSQSKKISAKQSNIDVEKRKCEKVQFLKYGRLVPLEVLDLNNEGNQEAVQLKTKMDKMTAEYKGKLRQWDRKVMDSRNELQQVISQNTQCIEMATALRARQNSLTTELNQILDVEVIKDSAPSDQKRNRELQKLVDLAKTQANEIDVLKAEIHMLQRKGGMLYAVPEI